jgi:hypothetical protein
MLKLDIAKALDSMAWPFLLEVMRHSDFGKWQQVVDQGSSVDVLVFHKCFGKQYAWVISFGMGRGCGRLSPVHQCGSFWSLMF